MAKLTGEQRGVIFGYCCHNANLDPANPGELAINTFLYVEENTHDGKYILNFLKIYAIMLASQDGN